MFILFNDAKLNTRCGFDINRWLLWMRKTCLATTRSSLMKTMDLTVETSVFFSSLKRLVAWELNHVTFVFPFGCPMRNRISWLRFLVFYLRLLDKFQASKLNVSRRFLPHLFQCVIHLSFYYSTQHILRYRKLLWIIRKEIYKTLSLILHTWHLFPEIN